MITWPIKLPPPQSERVGCPFCDGNGHRCEYCEGNGWLYAEELPERPDNNQIH